MGTEKENNAVIANSTVTGKIELPKCAECKAPFNHRNLKMIPKFNNILECIKDFRNQN